MIENTLSLWNAVTLEDLSSEGPLVFLRRDFFRFAILNEFRTNLDVSYIPQKGDLVLLETRVHRFDRRFSFREGEKVRDDSIHKVSVELAEVFTKFDRPYLRILSKRSSRIIPANASDFFGKMVLR